MSAKYPPKSPTYLQKSPTYLQKSHRDRQKSPVNTRLPTTLISLAKCIPKNIQKKAVYIHKRALYIHKRALYIRKRALYIRKRALNIYQKKGVHNICPPPGFPLPNECPQNIRQRALDICKRALYTSTCSSFRVFLPEVYPQKRPRYLQKRPVHTASPQASPRQKIGVA